MIESLEEYISILEDSDSLLNRRAANDAASKETWELILHKRPDLADSVAFNKKLPREIVDQLITHEAARVRSIVAMKRILTEDQFLELANDTDESVRIMIANNRKTPTRILEQLRFDSCELVKSAALSRLANR